MQAAMVERMAESANKEHENVARLIYLYLGKHELSFGI